MDNISEQQKHRIHQVDKFLQRLDSVQQIHKK